MHDIAFHIASFLACRTGLEESKVDTVRFGLEIILGEVIKWVILLTAATILGVLPGALFAMISVAVFKMISGGAHCEDYWRCLAMGVITFLGFGKLGVYLEPYLSFSTMVKVIVASTLFMGVLTAVWAPAEVPNRRITAEEKVKFKRISLVFLVLWAGIIIVFIAPYSIPAVVTGVLATMVQAFSFTPPGYWAIDRFDYALSRIIGERRCFHA